MKILPALGVLLLTTTSSAAETLPSGGGEAGKAYREFLAALDTRDWRTLHRVTTTAMFSLIPELLAGGREPMPPDVEVVISGTREGGRAELEVTLQRRQGSSTQSSTSAALMLLDGGQWRVASNESDAAGPPLSFESAETMRRMRELGGALDARRITGQGIALPKAATAKELAALLAAQGFKDAPTADAWGNPLVYRRHPVQEAYVILSYGQGGAPDPDLYDAAGLPKPGAATATTTPEADIVMTSFRHFLRYPRGAVSE